MKSSYSDRGFTLIELVTVIVVLAVVSVGISGFVRSGLDIYTDVTERDQLLSDSRFLAERLNRELRGAIPNSIRIANADGIQCIEFVPALWVTYYTSLPVFPDTTTQATIVEIADNSEGYELSLPTATDSGDFAFVYPTKPTDVYAIDSSNRQEILACTDANLDCSDIEVSGNRTATLTLAGAFLDSSPASRMYFGRDAVSYCAQNNREVHRYEDDINASQSVYGSSSAPVDAPIGVLMAEGQTNSLPFRVTEASLTRNGLVNVLLTFEKNDEIVNYNLEVHIPNVP
jgi:MSHA biogenesis protein MshO